MVAATVRRRCRRPLPVAVAAAAAAAATAAAGLAAWAPIPADASSAYRPLSWPAVTATLHDLASRHPERLSLTLASEFLPPAPGCDADEEGNGRHGGRGRPPHRRPSRECITPLVATVGWAAPPTTPTVLVVGGVWGDDTASVASAVALTTTLVEGGDPDSDGDSWVAALAGSRRVVVLPVLSAAAYASGKRWEAGEGGVPLDPFTDFPPVGGAGGVDCFRGRASRLLNELFRRHIFMTVIVFHGVGEFVAYPWGDASHCWGGETQQRSPLRPERRQAARALDRKGGC